MATGLNVDTDFTNARLYDNTWTNNDKNTQYIYIRASAFWLWIASQQNFIFGYPQQDWQLSYWNGKGWTKFTSGVVGENSSHSIGVNTTLVGASEYRYTNHTIFRLRSYCQDKQSTRAILFGIGGVTGASQRLAIKGKSPTGCSTGTPIVHSYSSLDSSIMSYDFMNETIMRGSCINDVASTELRILPPNGY